MKKNKKEVTKVTTPECRVSFPAAFAPKSYKGGKLLYSIVMLFDKKLVAEGKLKDLQNLIRAKALAKWGEVPPEVLNMNEDTCPFNNGDLKSYDGYAGTYHARAASQYAPAVLDTGDARKDIAPQAILDEKEIYAGCYARASVTAFTWEAMGRKGVSFGLQNIQKLADGEPFSGRGDPTADFDPIVPEEIEVADTEDLFAGDPAPLGGSVEEL